MKLSVLCIKLHKIKNLKVCFWINFPAFVVPSPECAKFEVKIGDSNLLRDCCKLLFFSCDSFSNCFCVLTCEAPSIANVQAAIEHIYPLVLEFRMEKPQPRATDTFCGGSAPTYAQSRRRIHTGANADDDFDWL